MTEHSDSVRTDPRYQAISDARDKSAKRARAARDNYKLFTGAFIVATTVAALAGGLILYGIEADPEAAQSQIVLKWVSQDWMHTLLFVIQGLSLGTAGFCAHMLSSRRYNETWTSNRVVAETKRLEREQKALEIAHAKGSEEFINSGAAFKLFVAQQMQYLADREFKHDRSAFALALAGAVMAGIAALAGALGGLDSRVMFAMIALLGVVSPALVAALTSWSDAISDAQRAQLYQRTWENLNAIRADQATFDTAIAQDDLDGARAYQERVFEALREDHQGFAGLRNTTFPSEGNGG
ncbi:MAG: DUF4231 domain-containing protein [Paracoccaceae bacterium]